MGMSKKASRRILIDGHPYRWAFSPDSGYGVIIVESETSNGQRLVAYCLPYPDESASQKKHRSVTPGGVARLVKKALETGWKPNAVNFGEFPVTDADSLLWESDAPRANSESE